MIVSDLLQWEDEWWGQSETDGFFSKRNVRRIGIGLEGEGRETEKIETLVATGEQLFLGGKVHQVVVRYLEERECC